MNETAETLETTETPADETAETTETVETEETTETDETTPDPVKQVEELEARAEKARKDAEYWDGQRKEQRTAFFKERNRSPETETTKTDEFVFNKPEPQEEDFENYSDWVRAHHRWSFEKGAAKQDFDSSQKTAQQQQAEFAQKWNDKLDELEALDPEIGTKGFIPLELVPLLMDTEHLSQIAYHFGENRTEAQKLVNTLTRGNFSPQSIALVSREIGKMEAKFSATPPQKTKTNAPSKTTPVGSTETSFTKDPEKMTMKEYDEWRDAGGGK